ncbi:outer membrane protein P1 [Actinobacillus equuli]|nr:outer membrane protein P1 [Actinobacillus equuli]
MNNQFNKTLLASLLTFSAAGVHAAAFQLAEISTSGLGMAYAGNAAVADNASVVATNPALMTKFKSTEFQQVVFS